MADYGGTAVIKLPEAALTTLVLDQAPVGDGAVRVGCLALDPVAMLAAIRDLVDARSRTELCTRAVYTARSLLDADAVVWAETTDGGAPSVRACVGLVEPQAFAETVSRFAAARPGGLPRGRRPVGPEDLDGVAEAPLTEGMADGVVAPVPGAGRIAWIFVLSRRPNTFTTAHVALFAEISRVVGVVAGVVGEVEDLRRDAAALDGATRAMGDGSSVDEVVRQACVALGVEVRAEFPPSAPRDEAVDGGVCLPIPGSGLVLRAAGASGATHGAVLRHLANLVGLSIAARRTELDLDLRVNGRFIEALVSGRGDEVESVAERARLSGVDLRAPHALVALGGDAPVERPVLDRVAARLRDLSPQSLLSTYRGCIIILWPMPATGGTSECLRGEVSRLLTAAGSSPLFAGISRACDRPESYSHALRESMFSMHVARHSPRPSRVTVAHESGMFQIAAYIVGSGAEREAVERTLGRLLDADRRLKSDLVHTLRAYLVHERRAANTARALFIHPNTLRYRLDQIRENLDLDLDDPDARFELLVALQLESILRTLQPNGDNCASHLGRLTCASASASRQWPTPRAAHESPA